MKYTSYRYLYPPRPETKIAPDMLVAYERKGWVAQVKKNGTCTVIFAKGDTVIFKTRHDTDHKMWSPKAVHVAPFKNDGSQWDVYVAELLHSKTKDTKDTLYVFDIIVRRGEHLTGTTFAERQKTLQAMFTGEREFGHLRVNSGVTVATSFTTEFGRTWNSLSDEDEGLVLKDPNGKLSLCLKAGANGTWQVKCRKSTKNYSF